MIRVIWKDNNGKPCPPTTYRNVTMTRYKNGWILDIESDNNIYASQDCAKNGIDKILGGKPRRNGEKRKAKGIKIIGTK
jgi:hypothetical protein